MKELFIAEKPSVARQFAEALEMQGKRQDGYLESEKYVITWCVGHLVSMSYPEKYDESLRRWRMETLPFIPKTYRYEVIPDVQKQFNIVAGLLKRDDVERIYVCTDSGREGEYIYRLVDMMAEVGPKEKRRVWIDSQTKEEILRGIREAKPESDYDNLAAAAFSRAKEDYLMGINFSRALTLRYGRAVSQRLHKEKNTVIAVGRVMTCVLGMIVRRELEIRNFQKTSFYKLLGDFQLPAAAEANVGGPDAPASPSPILTAEFRGREDSPHYAPTELYKNSGFLKREQAERFAASFQPLPREAVVQSLERKKETKKPPLLYNLAELQNDCSRLFKLSPDETLSIAQELYEKRLTTYPRTDARVLSSAVAKEIGKNLNGLRGYGPCAAFAAELLQKGGAEKIGQTRYTDDKQITDHYAIIPTGDGLRELPRLKPLTQNVYELIVRRFLSIFYPPAVYEKLAIQLQCCDESFQTSSRALKEPGYLRVAKLPRGEQEDRDNDGGPESPDNSAMLLRLRKGQRLQLRALNLKEGETSPPKRYTSGTMILAMENAGNLIEDEELRAQIKGSGIGTSATRAGILTKLQRIGYISLNKKTQVLTPTELGELITQVVQASVRQLLNPELTASWEKGLSYVAEGKITEQEYMDKLDAFVRSRTEAIKNAGR